MLKTLSFLAVGLVTGALVMSFVASDPPPPANDVFDRAESSIAPPSAVSASEHARLIERVSYLEQRLDELHAAFEQSTAGIENSVRDQISQEVETAIANTDVGRFLTTGASRDGTVRILVPGTTAGNSTFAQNGSTVESFSVRPNANPSVPPMPGGASFSVGPGPGGPNAGNVAFGGTNGNANRPSGSNALGDGGPVNLASDIAARNAAAGNAAAGTGTPAVPGGPPEAPQSLSGIEAYQGQTFTFRVTGSTEGSVWGSDIYTDDSTIAKAAVHAGLLRPGETGTILVSVLPGYPSYAGSQRFGVESTDYPEWNRSYFLQRLNSVAFNDSTPARR